VSTFGTDLGKLSYFSCTTNTFSSSNMFQGVQHQVLITRSRKFVKIENASIDQTN